MSVIFVYCRNCYFCCTKSVRLACSINVHWSRINQRMRDDQIKINSSSFMPLIRHSKTSNKPLLQTTLIKDTIYSLNGSSRNSVNVNPVSITCCNIVCLITQVCKSNSTKQRTFGLRILKGNLIATSLIGTDESLRIIDFFG